ncbi:XRE family transcriptional regulator [Paludisphaera sp.]|uniref:helix-turn-helix domain-containing protein n=1 Tax=Paludisphaera sp. TaxID=2017432 RepID=UPI00301DA8D9
MYVRFDDYFESLPAEEQARVLARVAEMDAQEASLRQLREARKQSQVEVAAKLKTTQAAISRLEKRTDVYLSTLRKYVEAVGGKLEIVATFPEGGSVRINQFGED